MFKKRLVNALPLLIIVLLTATSLYMLDVFKPEAEKRQYRPKKVKVFVQTSNVESTQLFAYSQGEVVPKQQIDLRNKVEGQVVYIAPEFVAGGRFNKGQVLFQIDPRDYELVVIQREAKVAQAKQNLAKVEAQSKIAQNELAQLGRDNANDLAKWLPQLEHARSEVKSAQASLSQAQLDLERTNVVAPFDGIVRNENVSIGLYVTRNSNTATLYANDVMEVSLALSGKQLDLIDLPLNYYVGDYASGVDVELSTEIGAKTLTWQGKIVRTEAAFDSRTRTLNAIAEVKVEGKTTDIVPGLFVSAKISGKHVAQSTVLARTALRKNNEIWLVDNQDKLQVKTVDLIFRDNEKVVITGLDDNTRVITSALAVATPGILVKALDDGSQITAANKPKRKNKKNKNKTKQTQLKDKKSLNISQQGGV
ncbi:efflux RND transporter periplasmic adaptor subunit [Saccharobesus litoralis]|uniref:Efflux RND transporter periplasmic adaptor subunit n=1 Tax=Saccharobesus litoralis TaxID=2172099 RepID=A0A2S0VUB0_9ALTE|nr:efflux RND transporter periplasmic adaptor subunit [Saccharobesus litoralis]AWB67807.1 efflux RND transporter periplasmic adaptor subunit [Saccharobesus litoralis]